MSEIKNKRLYEEDIVKKIVMVAVTDAIGADLQPYEISKFVKENFDSIVQKIIKKD